MQIQHYAAWINSASFSVLGVLFPCGYESAKLQQTMAEPSAEEMEDRSVATGAVELLLNPGRACWCLKDE